MNDFFDKKYCFFLGAYISTLALYVCSAISFEIGIVCLKILFILFIFFFAFVENTYHIIDFEKASILITILLFSVFMLFDGELQSEYKFLNTLESILIAIIVVIYFAKNHNGIHVEKWIKKNIWIILLILCFIFFSIETLNTWLMWDAWQYYAGDTGSIQKIITIFNADFSKVYDLYLAHHATLGYSLWIILFQLIKYGSKSVQIADIVLAGISIYAYYQILYKLLGMKYSNKVLALATAPYAFSPLVLGIIGNINLDSATMYFSIIFIACSIYHFKCLELVFAFLFCFTKETAVIYYTAYIIAKIICEYFSNHTFHILKLIKFGFANIKNYIYALPVILWFFLYKSDPNDGWGGEEASLWNNDGWNCFGINSDVILAKLKQVLFINFNWIFWLTIFIGIVIILIKKIKIEKQVLVELIPICIMGMTVIILGCTYITYILPRYIVPIIPILYLAAIIVIGHFTKKSFHIWTFAISILLLIQCFNVIDPVMNIIFDSKLTGYKNEKIYMVGNEDRFDDHIVYNRQNIYWSETLKNVLEDADYNGDMLIVFPDSVYDAQYELLGNWRCLWNTESKNLEYYNEGTGILEQCKWLDTCYVSDIEPVLPSSDYKYVLYIVPGWENVNSQFVANNKIIKEGEINHKGFNIQYKIMDIKQQLPLNNGNYMISPKLDKSMGISTDGSNLYLEMGAFPVNVSGLMTTYNFIFDQQQVAMDVQYDKVDENGTVWVWEINRGHAQQWSLEEINEYYMICYENYALTYDLSNNSLRLTEKTGSENQQWLFTRKDG